MGGVNLITQKLVQNCLNTVEIPDSVLLHAKKSLLNWLGLAIGASQHSSVQMTLDVAREIGVEKSISILGRSEKSDLMWAVLINGMSSHIFDFDDTHLATIHHPSGPVAPVVFALGEKYHFSGQKLLRAFALGCEAELRISHAIYPSHYDLGWHITSTAGVFGAAVAAGILLDLNEDQMIYALGIAGTQASGLREMFGSMTKPFHPGKAAQNGLLAVLLAKKGFTSSNQVIEAKRGFANVMAPEHDLTKVNEGWGQKWEFLDNSFKPYACGIVLHPSIDACIALRKNAKPEEVREIRLRVNPYVLELTGKPQPRTGLEGKFSIYHTATVAFLDGDASQDQYSDAKVQAPHIMEFRNKIVPLVDETVKEDQVHATLVLTNGSEFECFIEHATGSKEKPMTEAALNSKFTKLATPVIGSDQVGCLIQKLYELDQLPDILEVLKCCQPR